MRAKTHRAVFWVKDNTLAPLKDSCYNTSKLLEAALRGIGMRSLGFALIAVFAFGALAENIQVKSCVRLYCRDGDVNSKITNEKGHGAFFPAMIEPRSQGLLGGPKKGWGSDLVEYYIDMATWNFALSKCPNDKHEFHFYATAGKFEKTAPWVFAVKFHRWGNDKRPVDDVKFINSQCAKDENKK